MSDIRANIAAGLGVALSNFVTFIPRFLFFVLILVGGYFAAKFLGKLFDAVLERLKFDQLVERGGVKKALRNTGYDASDILGKLLFYFIFLFVLQIAFGVFGPNPITQLLTELIAYLPNVFVAVVIVVVAAAVARGAQEIVRGSLGGLSYGHLLANIVSGVILVVGIFAALNQLRIAPAIINGLFYAVLAIVVGSAVVAIGGGGIVPMRRKWEHALARLEQEAPRMRAAAEDQAPGTPQNPSDGTRPFEAKK